MNLNLDHEILKILEESSPFQSDRQISDGRIFSFREGKILAGSTPKEYIIEQVYENEEYINIMPAHVMFEKNLKVEIDYSKPVYIRYDEQELKRDGFIILSKV